MADEEAVVGVRADFSELEGLVNALRDLPKVLESVGATFDAKSFGNVGEFQKQGERLAQAFLTPLERLTGGKVADTDFTARLVEQMKVKPEQVQQVLQPLRQLVQQQNQVLSEMKVGGFEVGGEQAAADLRKAEGAVTSLFQKVSQLDEKLVQVVGHMREAGLAAENIHAPVAPGPAVAPTPLRGAGALLGRLQAQGTDIEQFRGQSISGFKPSEVNAAIDALNGLAAPLERVTRVAAAADRTLSGSAGGGRAGGRGGGGNGGEFGDLVRATGGPDDGGEELARAGKERARLASLVAEDARQNAGLVIGFEEQAVRAEEDIARSEEKRAQAARRAAAEEESIATRLAARGRANTGTDADALKTQDAVFRATRAGRNLDTAQRKQNLTDYLNSPAGFLDKAGASIRGAAPGDQPIGFGREFKTGFLGTNPDIGAQLGQTAKFSVFYGAAYAGLYKLTQGLHEVTTAALDYESSLVDLERATGDNRAAATQLANTFGAAAVAAGQAPNIGAQLGAQSIGLYGLQGAGLAQQRAVGSLAVTTASQLAATTGQTPNAVNQNIAGLIRSFNLTPYDQSAVQDSLTTIARRSGVDLGGLVNATADIGTLGSQAGFDVSDVAAMIARIASTTGQAPSTSAGNLRQVLSKADDPNVLAALQSLGIDTQGTTLAQQIAAVAKLNLPDTQKNQLIQKFGRGASGQALGIVLNSQGQVQDLAQAGRTNVGAGQADFNRFLNSVVGQIRQLGVEFRNLATDLSQTGILDIFYLLIRVLNLVVTTVDDVVKIFNTIPRPLRSVASALLELYAAAIVYSKIGPGGGGVAGVLQRTSALLPGSLRLPGVAAKAVGEAESTALSAGRFAAADASAARIAGVAGGVGGEAAAAGGLALGPIIAVIAGAALFGSALKNLSDAANQTAADQQAARKASDNAFTGQGLRNAAAVQGQVVRDTLKEQDATFGNLGLGLLNRLPGSGASRNQATARANQSYLTSQGKIIDAAQAARISQSPSSAFGDFSSSESVTAGLAQLATQGFNAKQQLDALNSAFEAFNKIAGTAGATGIVTQIAQGSTTELSQAISSAGVAARDAAIKSLDSIAKDSGATQAIGGRAAGANGAALVSRAGGAQAIAARDALQNIPISAFNGIGEAAISALDARGKNVATGAQNLDSGDIAAIRKAAGDQLKVVLGDSFNKLSASAQKAMIDSLTDNITKNIQSGGFSNSAADQVSATQVNAYIDSVIATAPGAGKIVGLEGGSNAAGTADTLRSLQDAYKQTQDAIPKISDDRARLQAQRHAQDLYDAILQARDDNAQAQAATLNSESALDQSKLKPGDKVGRETIALQALRDTLKLTRNKDDRRNLRAQIAEAQAQLDQDTLDQANGIAFAAAQVRATPGNTLGLAQAAAANATRQLARAKEFGSKDDVAQATLAKQQADFAVTQARVGQDSARRLAAISADDNVGQARASVANAKEALLATKKGDEAYYQALAAYKQAQAAYGAALRDDAANARKLGIDLTDPVANAAESLREARAAQAAAKSPSAQRAAAVATAQASTAYTQAKFTQNLSDVTTAHDLNRISDQQYLAYLDAQRQSLQHQIAGMKVTSNGYRQAVDDLNQIDGLIQAASQQAASQFNLGNIDLPTVYQVRRAVQGGLPVSQGAYGSSTVNIDGADTAAIIAWLQTQLGAGAQVVRTTGNGRHV